MSSAWLSSKLPWLGLGLGFRLGLGLGLPRTLSAQGLPRKRVATHLATHIIRVDEHGADALCKLGHALLERRQAHALRRHRHAQAGGLQTDEPVRARARVCVCM